MCKQIITKYNPKRTSSRMYRVQTNSNFHSFRQIYGISVSHVYTESFFQSRTSIWKTVFNYKILWFLCIYKWCDICFFTCDNRLHIFHTQFFQICCNLLTRARCDLVDHSPWKSNYFFIAYIVYKSIIYKACLLPFFCHLQYGFPKSGSIL